MADSLKRATEDHAPGRDEKRQKSQGPRKWRTVRKDGPPVKDAVIEAGDAGVIATCTRGKEGKANTELYELLDGVCLFTKSLWPSTNCQVVCTRALPHCGL